MSKIYRLLDLKLTHTQRSIEFGCWGELEKYLLDPDTDKSGLIYKGFKSEGQAIGWVDSVLQSLDTSGCPIEIYTDGGNLEDKVIAWAWAAFRRGETTPIAQDSGIILDSPYMQYRNELGELAAAEDAVLWARDSKIAQDITICHDYIGVGAYINGAWEAKSDLAKSYVRAFYPEINNNAPIKPHFRWVKGHNNAPNNEYVDSLCTKQLDLYRKTYKELE